MAVSIPLNNIVFVVADGSHIREEQLAHYRPRLQELHDRCGGLTPEAVVMDAKRKSSPLHDYFEWDDSAAAGQYRLSQASHLLRSIKVTYQTAEMTEPSTPIHYFVSTSKAGDERARYYAMPVILTDGELQTKYLNEVKRELASVQKKLRTLIDLFHRTDIEQIATLLADLSGELDLV